MSSRLARLGLALGRAAAVLFALSVGALYIVRAQEDSRRTANVAPAVLEIPLGSVAAPTVGAVSPAAPPPQLGAERVPVMLPSSKSSVWTSVSTLPDLSIDWGAAQPGNPLPPEPVFLPSSKVATQGDVLLPPLVLPVAEEPQYVPSSKSMPLRRAIVPSPAPAKQP